MHSDKKRETRLLSQIQNNSVKITYDTIDRESIHSKNSREDKTTVTIFKKPARKNYR